MLRRSLQQRLESLMQAARRMASGDLGARTQLSGNDEVEASSAPLRQNGRAAGSRTCRSAAPSGNAGRIGTQIPHAVRRQPRRYRNLRQRWQISRRQPALSEHARLHLDEIRHLGHVDFTPNKWHAIEAQIVENQLYKRGYTDEYEKEYIDRNGRVFPVSIKASLMYGQYGEVTGMWGTARDISERKQAEARLLLAARVFETAAKASSSPTTRASWYRSTMPLPASPATELADVYGQSLQLHGTGLNDQAFLQAMWEALDEVGYWEGEIGYRHRDGNPATSG